MIKKRYTAIVVLAVVLILPACGQNAQEEQPAAEMVRPVKAQQVHAGESSATRHYTGMIVEAEQRKLAFRVAGPVAQFNVEEGEFTRKGQVIARLDQRDYELQLSAAKARYEQLQAEFERIKELYRRQRVPKNDYDKMVAAVKLASAEYEAARNALEDTTLEAPFSGYVQDIYFDEHETVDAGMPVVALVDVDFLEVEVDLPANLYARRNTITAFTGRPEIAPETDLTLKLLEYYPKANLNQLYRARLKLEDMQGLDLAPGMNIQVIVHIDENGGAPLVIPSTALFTEKAGTFVWVFDPGSKTVRRTGVETAGVMKDGGVEIVNGLEIGQWIVTAGVNSLEEGQKVSLLSDQVQEVTER